MMDKLWEGVKATAGIVGSAAVETGKKGKLQTELVLIGREIENRKRTFGEELYGYVEPLSKNQNFYCADDRMTNTLRGPLLTAQREISALDIKRGKILERMELNEKSQRGAYVQAQNIGEKLQNAAKKTGFVSNSAKLAAELSMIDAQIKDYKQLFGIEMYQILVELEDNDGWLPTVRDIRSIYDQARRDVEKIHTKRKEKEKELIKLGGYPLTTNSEKSKNNNNDDDDDDGRTNNTPKYFKEAAVGDAMNEFPAATTTTTQQIPAPTNSTTYDSPAPASVAVQQQQHPSQFDDLFGNTQQTQNSNNNWFQQQQQPPQQQQNMFQDSLQSPQQQQQYPDPFLQQQPPTSNGGLDNNNMFGSGGMFGGQQQQQQNNDPFAGLMNTSTTTTTNQNNNDDPFAAFNNNSQQQQHNNNLNPLFRY